MLQTLSKHIQGWIAGVVIAIIAAAFILWGLEYYITRGGNQKAAVAVVNGNQISAQQLNNTYQALRRAVTQQGAVLDERAEQQLHHLALQQLIIDEVLLQTANKMGFAISDTEIQQEILHIPAFQENGQFSPQRFQQVLSNHGFTQDAFIQNIRASMLVNQLSAGIKDSTWVTASELAQVYSMLLQQRSFGYFLLPTAPFITAVHPTEEQIKTFYQQHADELQTPEQVKVAYLLLSPESLKAEVKVKPEEIQQFYQDHSQEFTGKSPAEARAPIEQRLAQQQLSQLLAAKSEQLADLTYTNPSSLQEAGKALGLPVKTTAWMSRAGIKGDPLFADPKVLQIIFSDDVLKQNSNSQPIELKDGGFLVVRVAEHQPSHPQTLAVASEQIKAQLQKEQGQKQAGLRAYQIQSALQKGESAEAVAARYHLAWVSKANLNRQDKSLPPQIITAVFALPPSTDPANKAVTSILLADGRYAIIRLDSYHNADMNQANSAELEKLRTALASRWGELDYQLFTKSAFAKAKIKITEH